MQDRNIHLEVVYLMEMDGTQGKAPPSVIPASSI